MRRSDASAEELFRDHAAFVASFLYRLGVEPSEVDDAVQEVFLIAHRKGGYTAGPATPRSWLGAIAVRVASHQRRARRRRREDLDETALASARASDRSPEESARLAGALARLQAALEELDVEHRAVLVLYELEGESCQAIAESLELPIGTVYSRLHNARKRLIEAHGRTGGEGP